MKFMDDLSYSILVFCSCVYFALCADMVDVKVYSKLTEGYKTFRIPCLTRSQNGTLLAFAEGRVRLDRPGVGNTSLCYGAKASTHDNYCVDKDIVVKKSHDGGLSWTSLDVLTNSNKTYFYSNPNTAVDAGGRIYLMYSRCTVAEYYDDCVDTIQVSDDNGESFTAPMYLNHHHEQIGGPSGGWAVRYAPGKPFQGRVLQPKRGTGVLYSDDRGKTWLYGPASPDMRGDTNEAAIAETFDESLIMVVRHGYTPKFFRSTDGGLLWKEYKASLMDPDCQMSMTTFVFANDKGEDAVHTTLLISHPNTNILPEPNGRQNMTIHASSDGGVTWLPIARVYPGPSAYSSIVQVNHTTAACLYERSEGPPPVDFDSINIAFVMVK